VWTKVKDWLGLHDVDPSSWHTLGGASRNGGWRRFTSTDNQRRLWGRL
jgi:hypothetical protein